MGQAASASAAPPPWRRQGDGLRLFVRLTPKAGRDAIEGVRPTADGSSELCIKVTAVPEKGRANAALLALLARRLKLPGGAFTLIAGETDRHKQILIAGAAPDVETALAALLAAAPGQTGKKG